MKSQEDIHIAMAGLAMLSHIADTKEERSAAKASMSVLCWVTGYPTDFDDTFKSMKDMYGNDPEFLAGVIKESIEETRKEIQRRKEAEQAGGHSE